MFDATVEGLQPTSRTETIDGLARPLTLPETLVTLNVRQGYKGGVAAGPLEVVTAGDDGMCGFDFKPGRRYLIFAWQRRVDGKWEVSRCSATTEFDGTGETAAFLSSLAAPATGARVFGLVKAREPRFTADRSDVDRPIETKLRLVGSGEERSATSSADGRFDFSGLAPGRYRLAIEMPKGYSTYALERDVELPDGRACARVDYGLSPAGRVTGVLVDAGGRPLPSMRVELTTTDARPNSDYGLATMSASTETDGTFEIRGLPPGKYIVGVNLADLPTKYNPYARTVYPSDGTTEATITIGVGDAFDLGTWRLPPPVPIVKVSGVAVWADGTPAAGAHVDAWDVTGNTVGRARGAGFVAVAADGTFTLELRQGRTYTFVGRDGRSAMVQVRGPRLEVGTVVPEPVRLVLTPVRR